MCNKIISKIIIGEDIKRLPDLKCNKCINNKNLREDTILDSCTENKDENAWQTCKNHISHLPHACTTRVLKLKQKTRWCEHGPVLSLARWRRRDAWIATFRLQKATTEWCCLHAGWGGDEKNKLRERTPPMRGKRRW